ncbi:deoxynucleotidyltransferase terminal-interacting protein 2-like [Euwallacea similis]|uniref:deoxynucleotidyltransferase terminal-interacting protein 2-like n=1 Tax=Euwallacea similis TaxID=1736056 RepID=UPI00344BA414
MFFIDTSGTHESPRNTNLVKCSNISAKLPKTGSGTDRQQKSSFWSDLIKSEGLTFTTLQQKPENDITVSKNIGQNHELQVQVQNAMQKAIVTSDFEQLKVVPRYEISKKRLQQERKKEREKTKGKNWYGLPATEMTDELKQDLEVLQMRSVLDPKRFYKKNDLKVLPKYFQVGKVMDAPLDFYNNRLTKKERKRTLVDELLSDAEFQKYNKRKFKEIEEEKQKTHFKSWKKAKNLKKKKKKNSI